MSTARPSSPMHDTPVLARSVAPGNPVDAALAEVLAAEQRAAEDVANAVAEAAAIAEAARGAARAIEARTDARLRVARTRLASRTAAEIAGLDADPGSVGSRAGDGRAALIARAVAAVAARLTGGRE